VWAASTRDRNRLRPDTTFFRAIEIIFRLLAKIRCVLIRHEVLSKDFFNARDGVGNEKRFRRSRIEKPISKGNRADALMANDRSAKSRIGCSIDEGSHFNVFAANVLVRNEHWPVRAVNAKR
jgi:hypothetical protein